MIIMWQIFVIVFMIWLGVRRWQKRRFLALYEQLKSDYTAWPFLGHAYKFVGDGEDRMKGIELFGREAIKKDGMTSFWLGEYILAIVIADPVLIEFILKTNHEKGPMMRFIQMAAGNGHAFAPVPIWRPRRKVMVPIFSPKNLSRFVGIFGKQSDIMVKRLRETASRGPVSMWDYISTYSMDAVCESTLGIQLHVQKNSNHPFLSGLKACQQLISKRAFNFWLHNDIVYQLTSDCNKLKKHISYGRNFMNQIIQMKRKSMRNKPENENWKYSDLKENDEKSFLELLIESSGKDRAFGYSDLELQEETLMLIMAGTDTSAAGMGFTLLMLARHPDVQDKVYQELQEIFGDSKRLVVAEDLPRLRYLDVVIRETLRLFPPSPFIIREAEEDITLPSGVILVKGSSIVINIWATHRNPRYWGDDAELFRPERFLDSPLKHPAQFLAFSNGPRNCTGAQYAMMSMKIALATLLRHYRLLPATPVADGSALLRVKFEIMLKDVNNFTLQLESR